MENKQNVSDSKKNSLACILILNWNGLNWLKVCIPSVLKTNYLNYKVLVVDNGSSDGSVEWMKKNHPGIELIENKKNLGFAEGNNIGIRHVLKNKNVKYIITLNNDIKVDSNWLDELVGLAEKKKKEAVGMIASKMLSLDNPSIINSCGADVYSHGKGMDRGIGKPSRENYNKIEEIFGPCAGAALYSCEMLNKIKLGNDYFDSDYFAYFEDVDLAWRARLSGYRCLFNPRAIVYHKMHGTSKNTLKMKNIIDYCIGNSLKNLMKNASSELILKNKNYFIKLWIIAFKFKFKKYIYNREEKVTNQRFKPIFMALLSLPSCIKKRRQINKIKTIPRTEVEKLLVKKFY